MLNATNFFGSITDVIRPWPGMRAHFPSLLLAFGIGCVAFSVFIVQQPIHDHGQRFPYFPIGDNTQHGRWMPPVVNFVTLYTDIPVLLPILCVAVLLVSAWISVLVITADSRISLISLGTVPLALTLSLLIVFPFSLAYFYYTWMTPLFTVGVLLGAVSAMLLVSPSVAAKGAGAFVTILTLATYQPSVSVIFTLLALYLAGAVVFPKEGRSLFVVLVTFLVASSLGIIGTGLYALTTVLTGAESHALETNSIADMPARMLAVITAAFRHLWVSQPDLPVWLKQANLIALIGMLGIAVISSGTRNPVRIFLFLGAFLLAVVATKTAFVLSSTGLLYNYRYNQSVPILFLFAALIFFGAKPHPWVRPVGLIWLGALVWCFVVMDLTRQSVLWRGQQHDFAVANRVLDRIEKLPALNLNQKYRLVRVGPWSDFRAKALASNGRTWEEWGDEHMDAGSIGNFWVPQKIMQRLGSRVQYKSASDGAARRIQAYRRAMQQQGVQPWPHASSVFIHQDNIVVYMQ